MDNCFYHLEKYLLNCGKDMLIPESLGKKTLLFQKSSINGIMTKNRVHYCLMDDLFL